MKKLNIKGNKLRRIKSRVSFLSTLFFLFLINFNVYADPKDSDKAEKAGNSIETSSLGKGLKNFFNDASAYMLVLSPIIGGLFATYFFIRKNAADEQDQKQWNKRLIVTGVCVIGAVVVSGTINVITGYFQEAKK